MTGPLKEIAAKVVLGCILSAVTIVVLFSMSKGMGVVVDFGSLRGPATLMIILVVSSVISVALVSWRSTRSEEEENARLAAELPKPSETA